MKKFVIVTPEFGLCKGGIQSWAYYIKASLEHSKSFEGSVISYREAKFLDWFGFLQSWFTRKSYILMTWKMSIFVLPLLVINCLFNKDRFVIMVHGNEILNLNIFQKKFVQFLSYSKRVHFICNSHSVKDLFSKKVGVNKTTVVYPFVDFPDEYELGNVRSTNEKLNLVTTTRLVGRKNISSVLEALKILKERGVDFSYNICGSGPEFNNLVKLTHVLGIDSEVFFHGVVDEATKWKMIEQSDLFLLPSIFDKKNGSIEGYGIVYIEANSVGTPVLSGNTGGAVEAVLNGITGIHTDGSEKQIAEAIYLFDKHSFSKSKLRQHAEKHHYKNQEKFLSFFK
ncbi:glycosyltransferase [Vibrio alginolyticus]